jgi:hypothetical protein
MISERKFAEKFTSFWNSTLPQGAAVSRYINLQRSRFKAPLKGGVSPSRRALVNEIGFRLFTEQIRDSLILEEPPNAVRIQHIGLDVTNLLSEELRSAPGAQSIEPSSSEVEEALTLAGRLIQFFLLNAAGQALTPFPEFRGCGILDNCRGDVLAGTTLYEVKSGDVNFRLDDLRQVLIYCALNHASPRYPIRSAGLLNPRLGVFFVSDLDRLAWGAAGIPADSLFHEINYFLTSQGISV